MQCILAVAVGDVGEHEETTARPAASLKPRTGMRGLSVTTERRRKRSFASSRPSRPGNISKQVDHRPEMAAFLDIDREQVEVVSEGAVVPRWR